MKIKGSQIVDEENANDDDDFNFRCGGELKSMLKMKLKVMMMIKMIIMMTSMLL